MTFGITGNTTKDELWEPVAQFLRWLSDHDHGVCLQHDVADGLVERGLADATLCAEQGTHQLAARSDVLLSFGGDGSLMRTAHASDDANTPILGVNMGRLGFLTKVEVQELHEVIERIAGGDFGVEDRMTLDVSVDGLDLPSLDLATWALNDVVVDKSGTTSMIAVETFVDDVYLNTYWADGLIVSTPTGSTAYALSVGGPILAPGSDCISISPIAPHTLTARPIVLPCSSELRLHVSTRGHPVAFAVDGVSTLIDTEDTIIRIRQSEHTVPLLTLPDRDYFATIRDKLKWGQSGVF
ncbi:MAG: NAD(+)/NADH kinase [Rubricoccaceae bacterium]